jgi:hypothetical protein
MKIGFTGTQRDCTPAQIDRLGDELARHQGGEFHDGDCVGSDDTAHALALGYEYKTVLHPPNNPSKRAFNRAAIVRQNKPYLERNHDIVDETDMLIATPGEFNEQLRSGTWATLRYARKLGRPIIIIWPDGTESRLNVPDKQARPELSGR